MSKIEWTEKTWNPIVGCSVTSPGCTNCYAMAMAARLEKMLPNKAGEPNRYAGTIQPSKAGPVWAGAINKAPESVWLEPLKRRKPTTWFVNSMGDLFHENVPDEWIDKVFAIMALCQQHRFQVLTKRSERMRAYFEREPEDTWNSIAGTLMDWDDMPELAPGPLRNVWLGVSAEDQRRADKRIRDLMNTPAACRFVSAEPLLGPIDFRHIGCTDSDVFIDALKGRYPRSGMPYVGEWNIYDPAGCPDIPPRKLDWIIVGGESGKGARPMTLGWAEDIVRQCQQAGVAVFVKQLGRYPVYGTGRFYNISDSKGAVMDDWPDELRVREMPESPPAKVEP